MSDVTCSICGITKEIIEFHKNSQSPKGHRPDCRACRNKKQRETYIPNSRKMQKPGPGRPEYLKKWRKNKIKSDPLFKLKENVRGLIGAHNRRRNYKKSSKTCEILGCSFEILQVHLEYTFELNYGIPYTGQKVHIDHKIPLASAITEEEILKLNHWTNLQYLTPSDNLRKGAN